jgi:hypothetical protein
LFAPEGRPKRRDGWDSREPVHGLTNRAWTARWVSTGSAAPRRAQLHPASGAPRANRRCNLHGGNSLSGPASATWKHGRYSNLRPTKLRETYERQRTDPDLISLREEIALTDARIALVLDQINDEDGRPSLWRELRRTIDQGRRLAETERKLLVSVHQSLTADQVIALVTQLVDVVARRVRDREVLAAVLADVERLISR